MKTWADFIAWEDRSQQTIDFKMMYVDITGDLIAGLMLSQIIYWYLPSSKGNDKLKVKREDGHWLVKADKDWWPEIRLTKDQARRARQVLEDKGIIKTHPYKFNGNPTTHIQIVPAVLLRLLNSEVEVTDPEQNGFEPESFCVAAQMEMGLNPNQDGPEPKTLTENTPKTTTETTSEIKHSAREPEKIPVVVTIEKQEPIPKPVKSEPKHKPDAFKAAWEQHPRKTAKLEAVKAWDAARLNDQDIGNLSHYQALRKASDPQWREERYIPHLSTVLRNRRWEDEWKPPKPGQPPPGPRRPVTPSERMQSDLDALMNA